MILFVDESSGILFLPKKILTEFIPEYVRVLGRIVRNVFTTGKVTREITTMGDIE